MIAALYVQKNGVYYGHDGVDAWDIDRDARNYNGPHPVVAHPPCKRWCQLAKLNEFLHGYRVGDDGGCFAHALSCVRRFGGVLEHPAYSLAFAAHDLPSPPKSGWLRTFCGGWVASVSQRNYGHDATKQTWLYANTQNPPELRWETPDQPVAVVSSCTKNSKGYFRSDKRKLTKKEASATPVEFFELLISIAESSKTADSQPVLPGAVRKTADLPKGPGK